MDLVDPVIEAETGAQALQLIAQVSDIAIVLCDVVMPRDIGGVQLALQAMASHPQLRILLMSGYSKEATCSIPGAPPLLTKPFTREDLARALLFAPKGKL